jgi:hypothetical protein
LNDPSDMLAAEDGGRISHTQTNYLRANGRKFCQI